jgi:hypothetical protein
MPRFPRSLAIAATLFTCSPAFAGTLRCTSLNGNLNCAGSGAVSCQSVNGHTVCSNAGHDVMQSFGGAAMDDDPADDNAGDDATDDPDAMPHPAHPDSSHHR